MKSVLLFAILSLPFVASSIETKPTSVTPTTTEQIKTHQKVSDEQRNLKQTLIEKSSPEEIHKAKTKVQKARVKANEADAKAE